MQLPRPLPPIPAVIRQINRYGLSNAGIARKLHVSPAAVCHWGQGDREPNFANGVALFELAVSLKQPKG